MTIKIIMMIPDIYSFYIVNRCDFCYNLNKGTSPVTIGCSYSLIRILHACQGLLSPSSIT